MAPGIAAEQLAAAASVIKNLRLVSPMVTSLFWASTVLLE
jgi:hypothetical protein